MFFSRTPNKLRLGPLMIMIFFIHYVNARHKDSNILYISIKITKRRAQTKTNHTGFLRSRIDELIVPLGIPYSKAQVVFVIQNVSCFGIHVIEIVLRALRDKVAVHIWDRAIRLEESSAHIGGRIGISTKPAVDAV